MKRNRSKRGKESQQADTSPADIGKDTSEARGGFSFRFRDRTEELASPVVPKQDTPPPVASSADVSVKVEKEEVTSRGTQNKAAQAVPTGEVGVSPSRVTPGPDTEESRGARGTVRDAQARAANQGRPPQRTAEGSEPLLAARLGGNWKVHIVGCGQCGANLAATFRQKPDFLPSGDSEHYPFDFAIFDTDEQIREKISGEPYNWRADWANQVFVLPPLTNQEIARQLLELDGLGNVNLGGSENQLLLRRWVGGPGVGGQSIFGSLAAKEFFTSPDRQPDRQEVNATLRRLGFTQGGVVVFNSLNGGTGSGFAPFVLEHIASRDVLASKKLALNVCILPGENEMASFFPRSIVSSLYYILKGDTTDNVILADNGLMSVSDEDDGDDDYPAYNRRLHLALTPLLLAPLGAYNVASVRKSLDPADIGRWTRGAMGFGLSEFCALGYASKKAPKAFSGLYKSRPETFLKELGEEAIQKTTVDIGHNGKAKSGIAVLCGPPDFFQHFLGRRRLAKINYLQDVLKTAFSPQRPPSGNKDYYQLMINCLQFEGMKEVTLTILLAGIWPVRLAQLFKEVFGGAPPDPKTGKSLADWLRSRDEETIVRLYTEELRKIMDKAVNG